MARAPKKSPQHLAFQRAVADIRRVCDFYGVPHTEADALQALLRAIIEGRIKVPSNLRGRGAPAIWQGEVGYELVDEVESIRAVLRKPVNARIIGLLQNRKGWRRYKDLDKRFYEARKYWTDYRRLVEALARSKTVRK